MQYQFFVRNRQGFYLAPAGNQFGVAWKRSRDEAPSFASWLEARLLAKRLPHIRDHEQHTEIVDQFGIVWTPQHATRVGLFGPPAVEEANVEAA